MSRQSLAIPLPCGQLTAEAVEEGIIRVTVSPGKSGGKGSPVLQTDFLEVTADPAGNLQFKERGSGNVLLTETGRALIPAEVEGEAVYHVSQRFDSPDGEAIWGLGQQQDCAVNYRGRFAHLSQYNTIKAVPVYLSSRGFGLLWGAKSLTEWNPRKQDLPLEYNPYTKSFYAGFQPQEDGEYIFIFEKMNRNRGLEKIQIFFNGVSVLCKETSWHPNFYTFSADLKAGEAVSVLLNGTGRMFFQPPSQRAESEIWSEAEDQLCYDFLYGPAPSDTIRRYRSLTGSAPMFPKWAYGYWQSRERYRTMDELTAVAQQYRDRHHPLDCMVQDWQYWGSYGWNAMAIHPDYCQDFESAMRHLNQDLHVHLALSVWPNFGDEPENKAGAVFQERGYLLDDTAADKHIGGYTASLQGFQKHYYDVFNPAARDYLWKSMRVAFFDKGVDAWWIDATEPNLASIQDIFHLYQTSQGTAAKVLNTYPLEHCRGIYENQRKTSGDRRVLLLSRSGFTGMQKYGAAVWSGDTWWSWDTFRAQIAGGIMYCMSGLPYWTCDIGGFSGVNNQDPECREGYLRWFAYGAFCPIFRAHGTGSQREIWSFGEEAEAIMHRYLVIRYRLLPYLYSTAWQVTQSGDTMYRGLMLDFPDDERARTVGDAFLCGNSLLVCPVTSPGAISRAVWLPEGCGWYDSWTGQFFQGGQEIQADAPVDKIPVFVRAGSILPIGPEIQYTGEAPDAPLDIVVYPGKNESFTLYDDTGDGYGYEQGEYSEIPFIWDDQTRKLIIGERKGNYPGMSHQRLFRISIIDSGYCVSGSKDLVYDGSDVTVAF